MFSCDALAPIQYLRARYYNPANGRFNRLDPFAGNMQHPQSLHKYAYVHGDPIQGIDPSGHFLASIALANMAGITNAVATMVEGMVVAATLQLGAQIATAFQYAAIGAFREGNVSLAFAFLAARRTIQSSTVSIAGTVSMGIGLASLASLAGLGVAAVIRNFDDLPDIVRTFIKTGSTASAGARNAGIVGSKAGAVGLARRADNIHKALKGRNADAVSVVRVQNARGDTLVLVGRNGTSKVPEHLINKSKGEIAVKGRGISDTRNPAGGYHSETNVLSHLEDLNRGKSKDEVFHIVEGGSATTSKPNSVCSNQCVPMMESQGLTVNGSHFWRQ